jgi:hypothetical protein
MENIIGMSLGIGSTLCNPSISLVPCTLVCGVSAFVFHTSYPKIQKYFAISLCVLNLEYNLHV